jgi:hypothetical protein
MELPKFEHVILLAALMGLAGVMIYGWNIGPIF